MIDPHENLTMVAIIAIRSTSDTPTDLTDLGEWLKNHKVTQAEELGDLSETFYGEFLTNYFQYHKVVTFDLIFPRLSELTLCDQLKEIEVADLLICVTILTPLIRKVTENKEDINQGGRFSGPDLDSLSEFIIWCDQKCILTLDQVTRTLISSVTQVATTCEVRIDRAKKRRRETIRPGALDPDLRVKYDILRHVRRDELITGLRGPSTPLENLSETLGRWPCAFRREPSGEHATIDRALRKLWADFQERTRTGPFLLVDSYDMLR